KLAAEITKAVMTTLHYGEESVTVAVEEVKAADWTEKCTSRTSSPSAILFIRSQDTNPEIPGSISSSGDAALCTAMAQRLDHQCKGRGGLPAARIEEMIAGIGWAPVSKHPLEPPLFDVLHRQPFRDIGEAAASKRSVQQLRRPVEGELAF